MNQLSEAYSFQELSSDGEPCGQVERCENWREVMTKTSLRCHRFDRKKLAHLIAISREGGPVDLVHIEGERFIWSARIQRLPHQS